MRQKASIFSLHLSLSFASFCASPHMSPSFFSSATSVLGHVVLDLQDFLFLGVVHLIVMFSIWCWSTMKMWLSSQTFVFNSNTDTLVVGFLQQVNVWDLLEHNYMKLAYSLRHPWQKLSIFFMRLSIILQHSAAYKSTDFTLVLKILDGFDSLNSLQVDISCDFFFNF